MSTFMITELYIYNAYYIGFNYMLDLSSDKLTRKKICMSIFRFYLIFVSFVECPGIFKSISISSANVRSSSCVVKLHISLLPHFSYSFHNEVFNHQNYKITWDTWLLFWTSKIQYHLTWLFILITREEVHYSDKFVYKLLHNIMRDHMLSIWTISNDFHGMKLYNSVDMKETRI